MTATTSSAEGGSIEPTGGTGTEQTEPQASGLLVGAATDRCVNCGAELAVDQRYCVVCGTRRGKPRFALASAVAVREAAPASAPVAPQPVSGGWTRLSAILALIAILVAIGIGVLIGNTTKSSIKQPVKVVVSGGALSSSSGTSSTPKSTTTKKLPAPTKSSGNFFGGG
jgi:hypothetical protein